MPTGGGDVDRFPFANPDDNHTITDFRNDIDLILLQRGMGGFSDVTVTDSGADVILRIAGIAIPLQGVEHSLIGAEDFGFFRPLSAADSAASDSHRRTAASPCAQRR